MRRGMFKEPRHHRDRVADGYTFSRRDYGEQSRYPKDADNNERYENWDNDDDSCMSSVCYGDTTSPQVPPKALDNMAPKTILPPQTWETVSHSQPQTPNPEAATSSLNAIQIQDTPMDDPMDRQSDTSSSTHG